MKNVKTHRATIETMINTAAIIISAAGTNFILNRDYYGFLLIPFAAGLEFIKYWGRHKKLW